MKNALCRMILILLACLEAVPSLAAAQRPQGASSPAKIDKTFEEAVRDARKMEGLFTLYLKDDKLYLEVLPEQFGRNYLFIPTLWTSAESAGAGRYMPLKVFTWEKLETKILFLWKNTSVVADRSPEYRRALKNIVPDSIVHSFKVESEPHPVRKSFLICLDDCFFSDLQQLSSFGDANHPYSVDKARTVWGKVLAFPKNAELEVRYTVASSRPMPMTTVPDAAAFTVNVRYSLSELPVGNGYRPRLADDRVGYFQTKVYDYDQLDLDGVARRYINRWHLVKKDPGLKISEPVEPIVFWLENTIPREYRPPIRDGILEWNKAYEKIGFKNAVVVKEMPDDAAWDPADVRYNTIRWIPSLVGNGGGGMGPSRVNPLTGQILDADVMLRAPMNFTFSYEAFNAPLRSLGNDEGGIRLPGNANPWEEDNAAFGRERDFGILDMWLSGKIRDAGEVPKEYVYDAMKSLACHEVGHTLGLRHNFKGSSAIDLKDLHDPAVTAVNPLGNSIMEYLPANLAPKGQKQGDYFQKTIGVWDMWVIEYGYLPLDADCPDDELPELKKIAARASEPVLIYGTDEDAYDQGALATSIDPLSMVFDLSSDPLSHTEQSILRIRDLWKNLENRLLFEDHSYKYLRQAFESTLNRYFGFFSRLTKWIGGIHHSRAHVGDPGLVLPFRVVDKKKQIKALDIIKQHLLSPDAFSFHPGFLQKMQLDLFVRFDALERSSGGNRGPAKMDLSLTSYLEQFYGRILRSLYDPIRLHRIQDNTLLASGESLSLDFYLEDLHRAVWREVIEGKPIVLSRRILQTEFLAVVAPCILKSSPLLPADAVTLLRHILTDLNQEISSYLGKYPGRDLMTRAHLENCSAVITEALKAGYMKNLD